MSPEKKEKFLLEKIIVNKISSDKDLMKKLLAIYEEEKRSGELIKNKKSRNIFSRYLKSVMSTNETLIMMCGMTVFYSGGLIGEYSDNIVKVLLSFSLGSLFYFIYHLIKEHDQDRKVNDNLKKIIKDITKNIFLTKKSHARKRIEMYKYTFSLNSIKEISKHLPEEEMNIFLDNKLSYEDINVFNEDCAVIKKMESCENIEIVLNKLTMKKEILNNLYNKN